jgi:NADH-ubiquinone oxidoreductase chain 4
MLNGITLLSLLLVSVGCFNLRFGFIVSLLGVSFVIFIVSRYEGLLSSSFVRILITTSFLGTFLICLTLWISMLMFLVRLKYSFINSSFRLFSFLVLALALIVTLFFCTDNLFLFYIIFEFSLLPTFLLILKWGYQPERLQASLYFVMYTVCGSLPLLFVILYIQFSRFSSFIYFNSPFLLVGNNFNSYLWSFGLTFAFLVKVPMWGVHL